MKKLYCVICRTYIKFEKPKISYLLKQTLVLSFFFYSECKNKDEKIFKEEKPIDILKTLGLFQSI